MALNPFFLQGSPGEQRLIQELINEQLKIYGVEVTYIPRKFVRKNTIIEEISSSKFDDNFLIEAYVENFDGYTGSGDILTKFGMSLRDELSLIISKERFEDFISPFLAAMPEDEMTVLSRPREGDLIYFPLGQRLFEVKFIEHERPFYQLGKLYVYELKCELFEYEDEVIDTTVNEVDTQIQDEGYITTINLIGIGRTATVTALEGSGYIRKIDLLNDGYDYTSIPTITIDPAPTGGVSASAVAITTHVNSVYSIKEILLTNAGSGYTVTPKVSITGGGGSGAEATAILETGSFGVIGFSVTDGGVGYSTTPSISIVGYGQTPSTVPVIGTAQNITQILIRDAGKNNTIATPQTIVGNPEIIVGIGTFRFNETVTGSVSGTTALVKSWDSDTKVLKVSINSGDFYQGENIVGSSSSAIYAINSFDDYDRYDQYAQNDEIEEEAKLILDFNESNPFGIY